MDTADPDTLMVVAGLALSLLALVEIYADWKAARGGSRA